MKSICICGSQRFKVEIETLAQKLRKKGAPIVYQPQFDEQDPQFLQSPESERLRGEAYKKKVPGLVFHHFQRIRQADLVYVYNPGGYLGVNTTLEIGFAHALNKPIFAYATEKNYSEGGEVCREILYDDVVSDVKKLFSKLR